jgi:hypothetical protein
MLLIHQAPSALTWVMGRQRRQPNSLKKRLRVSSSRPSAAQTKRPLSWSTTIVR